MHAMAKFYESVNSYYLHVFRERLENCVERAAPDYLCSNATRLDLHSAKIAMDFRPIRILHLLTA